MATLLEEKKINRLVKKAVLETLQDLFGDPDFGLELHYWAKKRLSKRYKKGISLDTLRKKYL
ncbi:MAG: hypothetical protein Q8O83_04165 [bacterium]|nr:hypothetical protein [bacterium]